MPRLPLASTPAGHAMAPRDGALKPAIRRKAVDLPQPEGPSRDRNSPGRTSTSNRSSATTPFANVLPTPRSATMGGASNEARVFLDIAGLRLHERRAVTSASLDSTPAKREPQALFPQVDLRQE